MGGELYCYQRATPTKLMDAVKKSIPFSDYDEIASWTIRDPTGISDDDKNKFRAQIIGTSWRTLMLANLESTIFSPRDLSHDLLLEIKCNP